MLNRSKLWAFALLAAVFLAGAAVGMGIDALQAKSSRYGRARGVDRMMAHFTEELALTPVQQDSIRAILERHMSEMRAIFDRVRPQADSLRTHIDQEIAGQLTADQRQRFDSLTHQQRQHRDSGKTR